jgi:hypothetical protein
METDACIFEDLRNLYLIVKFRLFINTFNKKFWRFLSLLVLGLARRFAASHLSGTILIVSEVPSRRSRIRSSVQP